MEGQAELQKKVEEAFSSVMSEIHTSYLKKINAEMHKCAQMCYERPKGTMREDSECAQRCQLRSIKASEIFESAIEEYNRSLTNCMSSCADEIRYATEISPDTEKKVMSCSKKCIDAFVSRKSSVVAKCGEGIKNIPA